MELSRPPLVVTFELSEKRKAIVADALAGASAVVYLTELDEFNTSKELRVIIKRIIAAARRGERDVKRLRDAGLTGLRKPVGEDDSEGRSTSPDRV
jgi:hypothetical protein